MEMMANVIALHQVHIRAIGSFILKTMEMMANVIALHQAKSFENSLWNVPFILIKNDVTPTRLHSAIGRRVAIG